jgi:glycosyltransferase involved in cell wall biosynthesis
MKVAVIHDWLVTYAGAERVLEQILNVYPDADIFTLVDFLAPGKRDFLKGRPVKTSFIQRLPFAKTRYRQYLPFMPLAIEQLDVTGYDLVISSSHAVAKGVITGPNQRHICYCHTPVRYAWDLQHQYLRESGLERGLKGMLARMILHYIRIWDARTSNGVDEFVANSGYIAKRIWKAYRREAAVIYPPVEIDYYLPKSGAREEFYLTASRMVPYKKMDMIVEAFASMPGKRLVVIGDGPDYEKVKAKTGPNTSLIGYQGRESLRDLLQRARAFVFAAEEDFGIVPVEAQACGTPVIAFNRGGALETVRGLDSSEPTGVFFNEQTPQSLVSAVELFEKDGKAILPSSCRENALRFSDVRFRDDLAAFVAKHAG